MSNADDAHLVLPVQMTASIPDLFCEQVAVPASLFLLGLNVASAAAGASIAKNKGRSVPLWVFKGALAGLPSVLELRGLPELVSLRSTGQQDTSGTSEGSSSAA